MSASEDLIKIAGTIRGTPTIYNRTLTSANTEYLQELPTGTNAFSIKLRSGDYDLKVAFVSTESGTNYVNVPAGATWNEVSLDLKAVTLYFQCTNASEIAEIVAWAK